MIRKLSICSAFVCLSLNLYPNLANSMEADWQRKRIEKNIELLQAQLHQAELKHDNASAKRIFEQLQEEYGNLDRYLNPQRALPGAVHEKQSHLYEQQTKGDEGLARWQQEEIRKKEAVEKAARLAEEERLSKIELDRLAAHEREHGAEPQPSHAEDLALAQRLHAEEEAAMARQRNMQEEAARRHIMQMLQEERATAARQRAVQEENDRRAAERLQREEAEAAKAHRLHSIEDANNKVD